MPQTQPSQDTGNLKENSTLHTDIPAETEATQKPTHPQQDNTEHTGMVLYKLYCTKSTISEIFFSTIIPFLLNEDSWRTHQIHTTLLQINSAFKTISTQCDDVQYKFHSYLGATLYKKYL